MVSVHVFSSPNMGWQFPSHIQIWPRCAFESPGFDVFFACPLSNCSINIFRLNNGRCDCPDCADENNFTCDTCGSGCPTNETCHQNFGYPCEFQIVECPPPPDSVNPFGLRCFIPISYLNDNFCDCLDCVDEEAWDCNNCSSGCPMQCRANPFNFFGTVFTFRNERGTNEQKAANCFGQQFNLNFAVQCPGYPANSILPTKLGCTIPYSALNDNRCDCPTCSCDAEFLLVSCSFLEVCHTFSHVLGQDGVMTNGSSPCPRYESYFTHFDTPSYTPVTEALAGCLFAA